LTEFIDLEQDAASLLRALDKDERLVPYGGGNFGMPLSLIEPAVDRVVPSDLFFMRSNGPVPLISRDEWRLTIAGRVDRPLTLTFDEISSLQSREHEAFLECAGNGRTRFQPLPPGTPWANDAVGNAVWGGVQLATLLEMAGVQPDAVDVVSQGGDFAEMRRGLPISVAMHPETMVVWSMNGEPLPAAHGGPVRLLVPGWAGIASTKWLVGLEVLDRPFDGFWNTDNYVFWDASGSALRPITEMPPKSLIASPQDGKRVAAGSNIVSGWAWSGYGAIQQVQVSVDAGASWCCAELGPSSGRGWRRWEFPWDAKPGKHRLAVRATDARRLTQPEVAAWNGKGYQMNAIQQISVEVVAE
jgi:DMSO/TMAO reductase YedYZ molybdopterin-dependent catalytic subunit